MTGDSQARAQAVNRLEAAHQRKLRADTNLLSAVSEARDLGVPFSTIGRIVGKDNSNVRKWFIRATK